MKRKFIFAASTLLLILVPVVFVQVQTLRRDMSRRESHWNGNTANLVGEWCRHFASAADFHPCFLPVVFGRNLKLDSLEYAEAFYEAFGFDTNLVILPSLLDLSGQPIEFEIESTKTNVPAGETTYEYTVSEKALKHDKITGRIVTNSVLGVRCVLGSESATFEVKN